MPRERVSPEDLIAIAPGEVALLNMTLPGKMQHSTGVMVLYADEESFTLMTPQGHMFAGWITFSAIERGRETVAPAQVLMRASEPIFELWLVLGGHGAEVDAQVVCVDNRRQYGAPFRGLKGVLGRA